MGLMTPELVEYVGKLIALLATIAGVVWHAGRVAHRRAWRPAVVFVSRANDAMVAIETIKQQLGPNGGKSVLDKLMLIDMRTRKSDARQSAIVAAAPIPSFEADNNGKFVAVNRAFETLTGYSAAELVGMGWVNVIYHHDREQFMKDWGYSVSDKRAFRGEYRFLTKGDRIVPVGVDSNPMRDDDERIVLGWFGTVEHAFWNQPDEKDAKGR